MLTFIAAALLAVTCPSPTHCRCAAGKSAPITFDDFAAVRAVSDPQLSPDGTSVLYAVRVTDVAANKRTAQTFVVPAACGATPRRLSSASVSATEARWSPDGKHIAYIAADQLWVADAKRRESRSSSHISTAARPGPSGRPPAIASRSRRPCIPSAPPTRATSRRKRPRPTTR